tara:strand:- start:4287 stop:4685 length:399 start_codon:yes stop_codon:yes gene_type:complete
VDTFPEVHLHFMGSVAIGALAALIGVLSGQGLAVAIRSGKLSKRVDLIEQALPELISRAEVQGAFQQVAQIEAQKEAQRLQVQQAQQLQARQAAAFGDRSETSATMNQKINDQLASLSERMSALNNQFGLEG